MKNIPKCIQKLEFLQGSCANFFSGASDHCACTRRERRRKIGRKADAAKNQLLNAFRYKMKMRLGLFLLVGALLAWTGHLCLRQTRGFALYKICSSLPFNPEFETSSLPEEEGKDLKKALDQPYRFLDKGAQCYVFLSHDGRYVIKFFKLHALQPA